MYLEVHGRLRIFLKAKPDNLACLEKVVAAIGNIEVADICVSPSEIQLALHDPTWCRLKNTETYLGVAFRADPWPFRTPLLRR